jgi:hypothetical protein
MTVALRQACNSLLDALTRPKIHALRRSWSAFRVCGYAGLTFAVLLAMTLVICQGGSPWVMAAIVLSAIMTFLGLALLTKVILGEERLIYYHHEIAVLAVAAVVLWLLRQPILAYLDVTLLGIGLFLACGRVGCLMVGCCHGQPSPWGIRYRAEHAAAGFTPCYVGVRLFPVQAVEALWVAGVVAVGSVLVMSSRPPGTALTWYVVAYGVGRFGFEFLRGDPHRPYLGGFSEAQWISLFLVITAAVAGQSGALAFHPGYAAAAAGLVLTAVAVALHRRWGRTLQHQLLHPHHVQEFARAVDGAVRLAMEGTAAPAPPLPLAAVHLERTSLGIQVSASRIVSATGLVYHYALSGQGKSLNAEGARALAELLLLLRHPSDPHELVAGGHGVFHVLIRPRPTALGTSAPPCASDRTARYES